MQSGMRERSGWNVRQIQGWTQCCQSFTESFSRDMGWFTWMPPIWKGSRKSVMWKTDWGTMWRKTHRNCLGEEIPPGGIWKLQGRMFCLLRRQQQIRELPCGIRLSAMRRTAALGEAREKSWNRWMRYTPWKGRTLWSIG